MLLFTLLTLPCNSSSLLHYPPSWKHPLCWSMFCPLLRHTSIHTPVQALIHLHALRLCGSASVISIECWPSQLPEVEQPSSPWEFSSRYLCVLLVCVCVCVCWITCLFFLHSIIKLQWNWIHQESVWRALCSVFLCGLQHSFSKMNSTWGSDGLILSLQT